METVDAATLATVVAAFLVAGVVKGALGMGLPMISMTIMGTALGLWEAIPILMWSLSCPQKRNTGWDFAVHNTSVLCDYKRYNRRRDISINRFGRHVPIFCILQKQILGSVRKADLNLGVSFRTSLAWMAVLRFSCLDRHRKPILTNNFLI